MNAARIPGLAGRAKALFSELCAYIEGNGTAAVAFSGGVDSSVVALAAHRALGPRALAITVLSELVCAREDKAAAVISAQIGIRHETVRLKVLGLPGVGPNPPDRCYHCKAAVFDAIKKSARKHGISVVMDGTNADDLSAYRPGLKALKEKGVLSPLAELGVGKADVRKMARGLGLPNWDAPSRPCLATRFPYGERLEPSRLARVESAEEFIASLGFGAFRVRDHGGLARLELGPKDAKKALSGDIREKIVAKLLGLGYYYVTLDLGGFRSGSMDAALAGTGGPEKRR